MSSSGELLEYRDSGEFFLFCHTMDMKQIEAPEDIFFLHRTLNTPAHISSLAFGHAGHLFAGSGKAFTYCCNPA